VRGGHLQTIVGNLLPAKTERYRAVRHTVRLDDGDAVVLHDDCPAAWGPACGAVLLIHGLAGCHESGYMVRIAHKLHQRGIRAFRMDLRRCGAGFGLARYPYHAGRSLDALAALDEVARLCPKAPLMIAGFSLGGNIALKLLGEHADRLSSNLVCGMAVNPSLDLTACINWIDRPAARLYDRHFVKLLCRQVKELRERDSGAVHAAFHRKPRGIREFDELYTAPVCGFGTAARYYECSSAAQFVPKIRVPTLILSSRDDPLVPAPPFEALVRPDNVWLHLTEHGGHLGYVGRRGVDPDRRWMDWRVLDWFATALSR
jgi:predicted alpha/beta-fold hydrolase